MTSLASTLCFAGAAFFSHDGKRIYTVSFLEKTPALRQINLADETQRLIPLPQLTERLYGVARSNDIKVYCLTERTLWPVNPETGTGEKIITAPANSRFWDVAYNPKLQAAFVTTNRDPLVMAKSATEATTVFVRRHDRIGCPVFTADGTLFYANNGDLWRGTIESEEERVWLDAERYAPLAWLETGEGTPSEMGVSDIAIVRDVIYAQLFRINGSGWGLMLSVPRIAETPRKVDGMWQIAELKLGDYKRLLDGVKSLGENDHDSNLCASPDETTIYYEKDGKSYLIRDSETKQLHLTTR